MAAPVAGNGCTGTRHKAAPVAGSACTGKKRFNWEAKMASSTGTGSDPLRYGMVGGGPGAFIGEVHRRALAFEGGAELTAGSFSSSLEKTNETGAKLGLDRDRLYSSYEEMAHAEGARADGIDFVTIVTPNSTHYAAAKAFLENGIHVVCDKPLTTTSAEGEELERIARERDLLFCVTYTYTGYPMVKHARSLVQSGELGDIRFIAAEYPQEWLATPLENEGQKQASWRTSPKESGISACVGDIGTHTENLVSYITGTEIASLSANLHTFVEGRELDDNGVISLEYENGAKGLYWVSQIAVGFDNALRVRIIGSRGSLEFAQENPNYLRLSYLDRPVQTLSRGRDALDPGAQPYSHVPAGHPEGYFEAFANLYATFTQALAKKKRGGRLAEGDLDFPDAAAGVRGVRFVERCVESSKNGGAWVDF